MAGVCGSLIGSTLACPHFFFFLHSFSLYISFVIIDAFARFSFHAVHPYAAVRIDGSSSGPSVAEGGPVIFSFR